MRRDIEVLVVERCVAEAERLKRILEQHNYEVLVKPDGSLTLPAPERRAAEEKFRESRDWLRAIFDAPRDGGAAAKPSGETVSPARVERNPAEREISESREWLKAIFDASRDGILVEDGGRIAFINNSYAQMLGYDAPGELLGVALAEILSPDDVRRMTEFGAARLRGDSSPSVYEFKGRRKDGSLIDLEASVSTFAVAGKTYIIAVDRDLSGHKRAMQLIRESEERFQLAARATNDVLWEWDVLTDEIWVNENIEQIFGYALAEVEDRFELWRGGMHPDDRPAIQESLYRFIGGDEETWTGEYRYARADGSYAFVVDRRILLRDEQGKPLRMVGSIRDITERNN